MVKKQHILNEAIACGMEIRSSGTATIQNNTKGYKSNIVSIRFDEGDYERLKEIAQEQGTNGAALIRKAVKEIIKAADRM